MFRRAFMTSNAALVASGVMLSESRGQAPAVRKLAFLVGVSKYQKKGFEDLSYCERDVDELAIELRKHGFTVATITGAAATKETLEAWLEAALNSMAKLSKQDVVLVGLSGHGVQTLVRNPKPGEQDVEDAFFCPVDAHQFRTDMMISISWLMGQLDALSGSSQNLVLVDACRNNPNKRLKTIDGSTVMELPSKVSVLFSSSAGKRSHESAQARHGVFTHVLLEGLRGEAADKNGQITWLTLASYVLDQVPQQAPQLLDDPAAQQHPTLLGNLVFEPVLAYVNRPVPLPPPRAPAPPAPGTVIENSIGTKLVLIPAGEFQMGSPESDTAAFSVERPQHRVRLSEPYHLGKYEVTQREWKAVMETEPWKWLIAREGDDYPAVYISHREAVEYCRRLSALPAERAAGRVYRLPTEAEWEHGCRGGNPQPTKYHFGDSEAELGKYAWYHKNAADNDEKYAHPVGQKLANGYGLHDMHGNVWEWCSDWYDEYYYGTSAARDPDPKGPAWGSHRVNRGGCWHYHAAGCGTAFRGWGSPGNGGAGDGFRLALSFV